MSLKKILLFIFFSQIFYLWVFWASDQVHFVTNQEKNLCGTFEKWNNVNPNWLSENWEAVFLNDSLYSDFLAIESCELWYTADCCKKLWFKYAWVPIGQTYVSWYRAWAEFLASKKIIQTRSFNPHEYKLEESISRKEIMKITINSSTTPLKEDCKWIFADVIHDWGCKYIETALDAGYISWNQGFRPNATLTKAEALKLILQSRDIWKRYDTGFWQEDYISTAYYLWYIDEKFSDYNSSATRGWIFEIIAKTYPEYSN